MILMIEDEPWRNDVYEYELKDAGFAVHSERGVDAGWQYLIEHRDELEAVIMDIMMAAGKRYLREIEAQNGLRTGLLFYRDIRALNPELPVVFLTNVSYDLIAADLAGEAKIRVMRKLDYLPHTLPGQVKSLLSRSAREADRDARTVQEP